MLKLKIFLGACILVTALCPWPKARAEIMQSSPQQGLKLGFANILQETPGSRREERFGLALDYLQSFATQWRLAVSFVYAPDDRKRSKSLTVAEDWTALAGGIDFCRNYLFRWCLGPRLALLKQQTRISFESENGKQTASGNRLELLPQVVANVDYAINASYEFSLGFSIWRRPVNQLVDWSWNIGLAYNFLAKD